MRLSLLCQVASLKTRKGYVYPTNEGLVLKQQSKVRVMPVLRYNCSRPKMDVIWIDQTILQANGLLFRQPRLLQILHVYFKSDYISHSQQVRSHPPDQIAQVRK